jgi:uncharacterized membrane protein (UPF0127 family)
MPHRAVIAETGEVLLDSVEAALTTWQRFRGLMLRRELPAGHGMWFPGVSSIHMFFMRFPIDVAYLDADNCVLKLVSNLKPWRLSACFGAKSLLEMPAGRAAEAGLAEGHHVRLEPAGVAS